MYYFLDAPLERIGLDCVQSKYPNLLQELFVRGPADAFFLVKCWANMRFNFGDQQNSLFAVDSFYESSDKFDIIGRKEEEGGEVDKYSI